MDLIVWDDFMDHQKKTVQFIQQRKLIFNTSEAGTGKTIPVLFAFSEWLRAGNKGRLIVFCPLSICYASWVSDATKVCPWLRTSVALSNNRRKAFKEKADIYITNHEAIKWIDAEHNKFNLDDEPLTYIFNNDWLVIDESTAFKHQTSQRSQSMLNLTKRTLFNKKILMTGTPTPNGIRDIFHQLLILDHGIALGVNPHTFKNTYCYTEQVRRGLSTYPHVTDMPDAVERINAKINHLNISFSAAECLDLPENNKIYMEVSLSKQLRDQYNEMLRTSILELESGLISASKANIVGQKLLQILTGSVYDADKVIHHLHSERYELVCDLVEQRKFPCLVACNYAHEINNLITLAKKRKITHNFIDGSVSGKKRGEIVQLTQDGQYQMLICQVKATSHGLTLTTCKSVIWMSPTWNCEHYEQFNKRIDRKGQTVKTETIMISAKNTKEKEVYSRLLQKKKSMETLLELLGTDTKCKRELKEAPENANSKY